MGVNHPTLNIPNMQYILLPELKTRITEAQNHLFESKNYPKRPEKWLSEIRVDIQTLSDVVAVKR